MTTNTYAFPQPTIETNGGLFTASDLGEGGLTMRDYFAAKAMLALITTDGLDYEEDVLAESAYKMADAMLAERGKS